MFTSSHIFSLVAKKKLRINIFIHRILVEDGCVYLDISYKVKIMIKITIKWNPKRLRPPKEWMVHYPNAKFEVIFQNNYLSFIS